jgi:methylated-DNA-[protein]-cysteine S-methyltransferase
MSEIEDRLSAMALASDYDKARAALIARAAKEELVDISWSITPSPFGDLVVAVTDEGLLTLGFGDYEEVLDSLVPVSPRILESKKRTDDVRRQLDQYFDRKRRSFDLPVDLALAHGFRRDVLAELAKVDYGETTTYAALAVEAGRPRAYRAVGSTMAANPIAIVLPCHRVLPSSGGLGNYGGGVAMKKGLLELEGVDTTEL